MEFSKKFGCSVTLLSILAIFAGNFSFLIAVGIFILVMVLAEEEKLRNNVAVAFIVSLIYNIVHLVLGSISGAYLDVLNDIRGFILMFVKYGDAYNNISKVFEVFQKLNAFRALNNIVGFAMFVISIILVIFVLQGKTLSFPGVSKLVEKNIKVKKD